MIRCSVLLAMMMVASITPAQDQPVEKARRVVDLLLQEKYQDVVAMFDAKMKAALTAEKLAAGLHPALQQLGAIKERLAPVIQAANGNQVVTLPVQFEQAAMDFVVSIDPAGEISGLWMRPAAPRAAPVAPTASVSPASASAEAKARSAVDSVLLEKYSDVIAMFSPRLKTMVSEEKLRSSLQPILRGAGAVRNRPAPKIQSVGDQQVVIIPVEFAQGIWEFVVTVDGTGDLAGFLVRPGAETSLPWKPPEYSKADRFRTVDMTVGTGEWQLPGTLALPVGAGPFPALVLVHGSGPNDRDETIGPQKPFRDLAEGLASLGIAVLRYEKRTRYAASRLGMIRNFTVQQETIDDALAAAGLLRGRPDIDPARIFVLGHSLGGYLIPRIGKQDPKLAGLISLAGSARPIEDLVVEQTTYLASLQGNAPAAMKAVAEAKAQALQIKALAPSNALSGDIVFHAPASYWLDLKGYDPPAEARALKNPMLFLQGERDYQVTMTDFALWKKALSDHPNVTFRSFPALNHLFEDGAGKSTPGEYTARPDHVAAEVIGEIADWIGRANK